jgi:hypothetical protein
MKNLFLLSLLSLCLTACPEIGEFSKGLSSTAGDDFREPPTEEDPITPPSTEDPTLPPSQPPSSGNPPPSGGNPAPEGAFAIGIPNPSFGIDESHTMYSGEYFAAGGFNYKDAGNGPYSHYIDPTASNCTDSGNEYGTQSQPRCSIPISLPEGSVVELHGSGYFKHMNGKPQYKIMFNGTATKPVFLRGHDPSNKTQITVNMSMNGAYGIVENVFLDNVQVSIPSTQNSISLPAKNMAFRNNLMVGDGIAKGASSAVGISTLNNTDLVENILIYNNHIHSFGQHDATSENDFHGVVPGKNSKNIWILKNHIHHMGGDSVQVHFYSSSPNFPPQNIYIAKNEFHDDGENAIDLKGCRDVIISENLMYNYDGFSGVANDGTITVTHYGSPSSNVAKRVWFLNNIMYGADSSANQVSSGPEEVYFYNNLIYNINNSDNDAAAFLGWSSTKIYIFNNTVYNSDVGIDFTGSSTAEMSLFNNLISQLGSNRYIDLSYTSFMNNTLQNSNLVYHSSLSPSVDGNNMNQVNSNPQFVNSSSNNFQLQANSPAINTGYDISSFLNLFESSYGLSINYDLNGDLRDSNIDIGAYEY